MSIMTVTAAVTHKYLMGKSKSDLAYMYLDLLEAKLKAEQDACEDAKALAEKLGETCLSMADWAQYAGAYFMEKHGLEDELKEIGKTLSEHGAKYLIETHSKEIQDAP